MNYKLFKEVVLLKDIPDKRLKKGDVATVVDYHPSNKAGDGYTLEVFNALGDTIAVVTVPESEIDSFKNNEIFSIREIEQAGLTHLFSFLF